VSSLLIAALALGWFLFLRPAFLGGPATYVMVSGASMEPTFHTGDLVIVREATPEIGQVAAYRVPQGEPGAGTIVIHRVIGGSDAEGWILQGDNNDQPDIWTPATSDFVGEQAVLIPKAATAVTFLRSPLAIALAAALATFFIIVIKKDEPDSA
jgi:signal peptidase I